MKYVFLLRFYDNRIGHSCLATVHRTGPSPRDVLEGAWAAVGKPADYAEMIWHDSEVLELKSLSDEVDSVAHLLGRVRRIEVSTVGRIVTLDRTTST